MYLKVFFKYIIQNTESMVVRWKSLAIRILDTRTLDNAYVRLILVVLMIVFVYLYWSGEYRKVYIRLRLIVARSGGIVLSGVCLSLRFVLQEGVHVPRQNNNMSRFRFASSTDSCAATACYPSTVIFYWCAWRIFDHAVFDYLIRSADFFSFESSSKNT